MVNKSLTILNLDYNKIDYEALKTNFYDGLRMNTHLFDLSLKNFGINDDNIELVLKALSTNSTIHILNLAENDLTDISMKIFYQWFYLDRSVKTLSVKHLDLSSNRIEVSIYSLNIYIG